MEYMENQMDNLIESGIQKQNYLYDNLIPGNSIKFGKEYCKANNCIYLTNTVRPIVIGFFDNDNGGFTSVEQAPSVYNKENTDFDSMQHLFENNLSGFMDCEIIINMRKKLTEDVLHPYLPYGLEVDILNYNCDYVGISKSTLNGYYFINELIHYTYVGGSTGKDLSLIKLYLVNIKNLTLEWVQNNIDINIVGINLKHENNLLMNPPRVFICYKSKWGEETWSELNYQQYQELFKAKFDLFNLINSGLANEISFES